MLARRIGAKHLVNTFHLWDHHGRNTKISTTGGHEYAQESTHFPPGVRQKNLCISSRAKFSHCIPCCSTAQQLQAPSSAGFNLTKAWLCWHLPKIHLEVLTAILVGLRKAPGEVMMCWREASGIPTAIFSLGSEEDHTVCMFICLPACPSVRHYPPLPHVLSYFLIHFPASTKTYWQLKAHEISRISWKPAFG